MEESKETTEKLISSDETSLNEEKLADEDLGEELDEEADEESDESSAPKSKAGIIVGVVLLALFVLLAWYFYFGKAKTADETATESDKTEIIVSVRTAQAETKTISAEISAVGTIFPLRQAVVSANMNGQIKEMRLLKDTLVRQGELIARIDTRDLQAQRAEAVAALSEVKLNLESLTKSQIPAAEAQNQKDLADANAAVTNARALVARRKILYEKGGIALKDLQDAQLVLTNAEDSLRLAQRSTNVRKSATNPLDTATANSKIQQAEQRIKTLDAQTSLAEVRAPLTGFVIEQTQFSGEYATSGGKLLTIADTGEIVVKANFADTVVADVKVGDSAAVFPADLAGEQMSGKVSQISRSSDVQNRAVEIWVRLLNDAGRLRLNSAAEVRISTKTQNDAVVVPVTAVTLESSNDTAGMVITVDKDNIAHETKVEIGLKTKDEVQIVEGLKDGERVVVEGNLGLTDGTKVEEKQDDAAKDAPTSKPKSEEK